MTTQEMTMSIDRQYKDYYPVVIDKSELAQLQEENKSLKEKIKELTTIQIDNPRGIKNMNKKEFIQLLNWIKEGDKFGGVANIEMTPLGYEEFNNSFTFKSELYDENETYYLGHIGITKTKFK